MAAGKTSSVRFVFKVEAGGFIYLIHSLYITMDVTVLSHAALSFVPFMHT